MLGKKGPVWKSILPNNLQPSLPSSVAIGEHGAKIIEFNYLLLLY
jgi:hypothetical protein